MSKAKLLEMIEREKEEARNAESYQDSYGACARAMGVLNVLKTLGLIDSVERSCIKAAIWEVHADVLAENKLKAIDRKFIIHAQSRRSKKIYNEQSGVLFLARDKAFLLTLPDYLKRCNELGADAAQIASVKLLIERVQKYQNDHPDEVKVPDVNLAQESYLLLSDAPAVTKKTAEERGMEMMLVPMGKLPPLALAYAQELCRQVGQSGDVLITAWTVYAQLIEELDCADEAYKPTPDARIWFARNKEKAWRVENGRIIY